MSKQQPSAFLDNFQKHSFDAVRNAYTTDHLFYEGLDGTVTTSLTEDVFFLLDTQRSVLMAERNERILVEGMLFVLKSVQHEHTQMFHQQMFGTLEETCAAANDLFRMAEKMEQLIEQLNDGLEHKPFSTLGDEMVQQLSRDAVLCTERSLVFFLRSVHHGTNIRQNLFSEQWEELYVQNEVARKLVHEMDKYLHAVKKFLADEILYQKAVWMAAQACICFYIRSLVDKAEGCRRRRNKPFISTKRALLRMSDDIAIISEYLQGKPELSRRIRTDLDTLHLIRECLGVTDSVSLESFVIVLHKRTGSDALVTRQFVTDLQWLVGQPRSGKEAFEQVQPDLHMVTRRVQERQPKVAPHNNTSQLVRLDDMLKTLYEDRLVQGVLPVCWMCLPNPPQMPDETDNQKIANRIRSLTRNVTQFRLRRDGEVGRRRTSEEHEPLAANTSTLGEGEEEDEVRELI